MIEQALQVLMIIIGMCFPVLVAWLTVKFLGKKKR